MSDSDDEAEGGDILPRHYQPSTAGAGQPPKPIADLSSLSNVWDDREEVFDVGDESDDEDAPSNTAGPAGPRNVVTPHST